MTPEQIYKLVNERAEVPHTRLAYWLDDEEEGDNGDNYCADCVIGWPSLPGLVVCHLLSLLGFDMVTPPAHAFDAKGDCAGCNAFDSWTAQRPCWTWPRRIIERADAARSGGYHIEEDGWISCAGCGADLEFCPTSYFARSEFDHFEVYGPPDTPREWWEISVSIEALHSYWTPAAATDPGWLRLGGLLEKWGITAESAEARP